MRVGVAGGRRYERLLGVNAMLADVARHLGPAHELGPVLSVALTAMRSLVQFRGGTICLVDDQGVYVAASDPPVTADVAAAHVPVGSGLAGRCVAEGETIYSPDVTADERVDQTLRALGSNAPMRSYLGVPLVCLGEVIGVLQVDSTDVDAFDVDDRTVLEGLAAQVAGAIESARRYEAMRHLDEARAVLIARVSHELRTPLTIMTGMTSVLARQPERYGLNDEAIDLLRRVEAAGDRLEATIEELVTIATIETGLLLAAEPVPVRLAELLEQVAADSSAPQLLAVDCPTDLEVVADARLVGQVVRLLVTNAIGYAGGGLVSGRRIASGVAVAVVDHGPGIPDDRKAAVFERFVRGDQPGSGWGLGLSVASRLAQALGTTLRLTDTPGGGATFTVVLPARG